MRQSVLALLLISACTAGAEPNPRTNALAGRWAGVVEHRGAAKRTVVDFHAGDPPSGTVSSPDELPVETPLRDLRYDPPRLRFAVEEGDRVLAFDGQVREEEITGHVEGGGLRARLSLRRQGEVPPIPFTAEEVRIPSTGATLAGTLLLSRGPHPAVVLIHGSGPGPRESLRPLAQALASRGIAALIYDKRGREEPFERLADDAAAAVEHLKRHGGIDPRQSRALGRQ